MVQYYKIVSDYDDVYVKICKKTKDDIHVYFTDGDIIVYVSIKNPNNLDMKEVYIESWNGPYSVNILNVIVSYIYTTFGESDIHIMDTFYKSCNDYVRIPLSYYYLANFSVTWLEANYNARPYTGMQEYKDSQSRIKGYLLGDKPSFDIFCKQFHVFSRMSEDTTRLLQRQESKKNDSKKETLSSIYKYSRNIQEFIQKVDRCNNALYRTWLVNLIEYFFKSLLFKTWIIPIQPMIKTITIQPLEKIKCESMFKGIEKHARHSLEV